MNDLRVFPFQPGSYREGGNYEQQRTSAATQIRKRVSHPIIDADGHWIEFGSTVREHLKRIGEERAVAGFSLFGTQVMHTLSMSVAERREQRMAQEAFWAVPTKNMRDRATAMLQGEKRK